MEFQIRKAQIEDAAALAGLLREIGWFAAVNAEQPGDTRARVLKHLSLCLADDSHAVYVAEGDTDELLGYVSIHWLPYLIFAGPEGYVSELFVREAARGQGIGTRLLDTAEEEAQSRGCVRMMLLNGQQKGERRWRF